MNVHVEISIEELRAEEWPRWRDIRLASLREAADAFGSRYEDWSDAAEDRWRGGLQARAATLVARMGRDDVGVASLIAEGEGAEIISMWVQPQVRGHGVGDALMERLVEKAEELFPDTPLQLAVKSWNAPAQRLYERHGFRPAGPNPEDDTEILMLLPVA